MTSNDSTYTPRHGGAPKHQRLSAPRPGGRRAARLAAESNVIRPKTVDGLRLLLRISGLESAKDHLDKEIETLKRHLKEAEEGAK